MRDRWTSVGKKKLLRIKYDYNLLTGEYTKKKADKKEILKTTKGTMDKLAK